MEIRCGRDNLLPEHNHVETRKDKLGGTEAAVMEERGGYSGPQHFHRTKTQGKITEFFKGLGTFDSTTILEVLGKDN
ncbi:MAG: hypothetical protein Q9172_002880 [Xanthocarpia lactea]